VEISGYHKLPPNDQEAVMAALAHIGPLAVNVQADNWADYHSGVFSGCSNLSNVAIDHVVQLVGYGTDAKLGDYWLVRNSWDTVWGENGYIRLARQAQPRCGVDVQPLDGTGCAGGPSVQHVCGECGVLFDVSFPLDAKIVKYGKHKHSQVPPSVVHV
jgi:cathepsin L